MIFLRKFRKVQNLFGISELILAQNYSYVLKLGNYFYSLRQFFQILRLQKIVEELKPACSFPKNVIPCFQVAFLD